MKLLIDIGNTRLKWAFANNGDLVRHGAAAHAGLPAQALAELPVEPVDAIWIAHVTGAAQEPALVETLHGHYGIAPRFARSSASWHGLKSAYREPERLGVDRWLAMMAAWHRHHGAVCVVDAGTALTADVVAHDGQHQGGFIAAGLDTQQRAVLGATRFATRDAAAAYDTGLGRDTESCVRQGALLACVGAVERAALLAGPSAKLLLTGGDAAHLQAALPVSWQHRPHLVLEGLEALASSAD